MALLQQLQLVLFLLFNFINIIIKYLCWADITVSTITSSIFCQERSHPQPCPQFCSYGLHRSSSASSFLLVQSYLLIFRTIINNHYLFQSARVICALSYLFLMDFGIGLTKSECNFNYKFTIYTTITCSWKAVN